MTMQTTAAFGIEHVALLFSLSSQPSNLPPQQQPIPVREVIKVYGSLATSDCYGAQAPRGSSCQLPLSYLKDELGLSSTTTTTSASLSQEEFTSKLNDLDFQWPLKPYGRDKSLTKTVVMNKGAETAVFMNELEQRGLYDRRNPTGPLPTSLRPKLNQELDREGIDPKAANAVFRALALGKEQLTAETLDGAYRGEDVLDYYGFLDLLGMDAISWP